MNGTANRCPAVVDKSRYKLSSINWVHTCCRARHALMIGDTVVRESRTAEDDEKEKKDC